MKFARRERSPRQRGFLSSIKFFGAWGFTALLSIPMLIQTRTLINYLAWLLINNDSLRPPGWNSQTIYGVDKCTNFLAIGAWLMIVMFAESHIREVLSRGRFLAEIGKMWLIIIGIYAASAILLFLIA